MIGSRTPFRISFAGGGSDLPAFYRTSPGCVLSTTIDKYMYVFVHPSFDGKTQVKYSQTELVDSIDDIQHPIVRETLRLLKLEGVDISSIADIPSGTGLGSSSSFTVGLFNALHAYTGQRMSRERLARDACRLEIDRLHEPIGRQDQYAAAYGGLNLMTFDSDDSVTVEPVEMKEESLRELERNLLMFYVGGRREASKILTDQARNSGNHREHANLVRMAELARELRDSLVGGRLDDMGSILDESWHLKRSLSDRISNQLLDDVYATAKKSGALGGKILGAGGTGFFLFYCRPEQQERLRKSLGELKETRFKLETEGAQVIYDDSD